LTFEESIFFALKEFQKKEDLNKYTQREIAKIFSKLPEFQNKKVETIRRAISTVMAEMDSYENYYSQPKNKVDELEIKIDKENSIKISAKEYKEAIRKSQEQDIIIKELKKQIEIYKDNYSVNEKIISYLKNVVKPEPILTKEPKIEIKKDKIEQVKVALISDVHFDEVVKKEQVMNFNEYNQEVALKRLWKFLKASILITENDKKIFNINQLNIFFLGDMLSGIIHDELIETNESNVSDSIMILSDVLAQMIIIYTKYFNKIVIDCDFGNHGRITQKKTYKNRYVNFDTILYNIIKLRLQNYINSNRVEMYVNTSPYGIREILGWKFLHSHGDDVKSWNQISYYGLKRRFANIKELYESSGGFDYWLNAHTHKPAYIDQTLTNGSIIGLNEYSLAKFGNKSPISQKFFGVNKEYGVNGVYDLQLHNAKEHNFILR